MALNGGTMLPLNERLKRTLPCLGMFSSRFEFYKKLAVHVMLNENVQCIDLDMRLVYGIANYCSEGRFDCAGVKGCLPNEANNTLQSARGRWIGQQTLT